MDINFSRNSNAYNSDGSVVAANVPRFQDGRFNKGILIEEGTTNLFPVLDFTTNWDASQFDKQLVNGFYRFTCNSNYSSRSVYYNGFNLVTGNSYTYSIEVCNNAQPIKLNFGGGTAVYTSTDTIIPANSTGRFSVTCNCTVSGKSYPAVYINAGNANSSGMYYDIRLPQLEQKSYATSFTDSTRQPEFLMIPTSGVLNANEGTIEIVINPLTIQSYNNFLWIPINTGRFLLFFNIQGAVFWDFGPVNSSISTQWNYISAGSFYSFILRWSASKGTREMFINGVKIGSLSFTPPTQSSIPATFALINNFSAIIDDLRISSIARSDTEIAANYASNKPLPVDSNTTLKMNFDSDLSYHVPYTLTTKTETNKYIKIFDRNHNVLDEINEFNFLKYKFTLNGTGTCTFSIPLSSKKCTKENFLEFNEVEIWEDSKILWWGLIIGRDFRGGLLTVNCYSYLFILSKVMEFPYTYSNMTISQIIDNLLMNVSFFRGSNDFTAGNIDNGLLMVDNTPFKERSNTAERLKKFVEKFNYDFEIDSNKRINVYNRKGSIKDYYTLQYGTDADNIITEPQLSFSALNMANIVRADGTNAYGTVTNDNSIQLYGKMGEEFNPSSSDISQGDMDNELNAELQRAAYPTVAVSITAIDSSLCPFSDMEVGDTITVYLKNYWDFKETLRIVEYEHDAMTGKRNITAGQIIYRPQMPQKKLYIR